MTVGDVGLTVSEIYGIVHEISETGAVMNLYFVRVNNIGSIRMMNAGVRFVYEKR